MEITSDETKKCVKMNDRENYSKWTIITIV